MDHSSCLVLQILVPRVLDWKDAKDVKNIACGPTHTLILTTQGQVYSCGSNDHSQLGHELPRKRPRMSQFRMWANNIISFLSNFLLIIIFVFVAFGANAWALAQQILTSFGFTI